MLEFACPKCAESVKSTENQAGESIICPKCQQTIRVPGNKPTSGSSAGDEWSVFDEDEKFIEESVAKQPNVQYRTREDDREALVDNDEEEAKKEEQEERAAVAETLAKTKSFEFPAGPSVSSDMTVDEKMAQDAKFQKEIESLPPDSPLREKAWNRESVDTPESIRLENQPQSTNSIAVKCPVCESVTLVSQSKVGKTVVCSDCGSRLDVPKDATPTTESGKKEEWEKWAQKEANETAPKKSSKIADELFIDAPANDEEEYGLAPAPDNLLQPVVPVYDEAELTEAEDAEEGLQQQRPYEEKMSEASAREPADLESSKLFEEMQADKVSRFERLPWVNHLFGILLDPAFLIRMVVTCAVMIVGYSIFHFASGMAAGDGKFGAMFGKLIQIFSIPFLPAGFMMICWLGQTVMNSTILGEKHLPEVESTSVIEWISNSLFVAIGFGMGFLPGAMLGGLIWMQITEWQGFWIVLSLGTMTAMVISPLLILSAMLNRSPFKISSQKIADSIKLQSDAWIEFYIFCIPAALVVGSFWFLALPGNWFLMVFALLLINAGIGIYFRALGRLMGSIVEGMDKAKKTKPAAEKSN